MPFPPVSEVGRWVIGLIVIAGIIAVLYVASSAMGIAIPGFVITIFWIVFVVVLCAAAVRVLMGLFQ